MKTIRNITTYMVVALMMLFSGCEKYLETKPDMRTDINSVDKVAQLLASAYPQSDYISFMEMASDNAEDRGADKAIPALEYADPYNWRDHIGTNRGSTTHYWNNAYSAIAVANHALAAIEEMGNGPEFQPYRGEALVARAYAHFMLVNIFAQPYKPGTENNSPGIPYVTEPEEQVVVMYDRETVAATYEKIEADLLEGLPLIRNSAYDILKYRFNQNAAKAFAARFYLFKGDWDRVVHYATDMFPAGDWIPNIRPWSTTLKNYTAAELNTNFNRSNQKWNLLLIEANSVLNRAVTYRYGMGNKLRLMFVNPNVTGKRLHHTVWTRSGDPNYHLGKTSEYFYYTGPGIGNPYIQVPALTTDEALLNRAEAYVHLEQYENAIRDLNMVFSTRTQDWNEAVDGVTMQKALAFYNLLPEDDEQETQEGLRQYPPEKQAMLNVVLDLKKAEFIFEGLRWFDVIRHDITVEHNFLSITGDEEIRTLEPGDLRRVFQIPEEALLSGVELNPR